MLKGADLSKLLDDDYGDAGFNDPVVDLDDDQPAKGASTKSKGSAFKFPEAAAKSIPAVKSSQAAAVIPAPKASATASKSSSVQEPYARPPVLSATLPPPEDADEQTLQRHGIAQAIDEAARSKGYKDASEFEHYLQESGQLGDMTKAQEEMNETPLAPGIKKPPAWQVPGAYPGDRTKVGKEYEKEMAEVEPEAPWDKHAGGYDVTFIRQSEKYGPRPQDGNTIKYKLDENGEEASAEIGSGKLPWALDLVARRMKAEDIVSIVARGEHAITDEEELIPNLERHWRFELLSFEGGRSKNDKFSLTSDERIDRANELRLTGNDLFKKGRLLRACDFYERGSALMDVLEAEDLGSGQIDKAAAAKNERIWACQKPLLLNWALILMKHGRWRDAERKCTEVLMDIDKLNVKALFRRGQCNINLGDKDLARTDLMRARELDTSIAKEVEKELVKVEAMQKIADNEDREVAKNMTKGFFKAGDARSSAPPPKVAAPKPEGKTLQEVLEAQEKAADEGGVDEDTWCRQREAIYNQFLTGSRPPEPDEDTGVAPAPPADKPPAPEKAPEKGGYLSGIGNFFRRSTGGSS